MAVAMHDNQRMMDLCLGDQSKGFPYFLRFGHSGGGAAPSKGGCRLDGWGRSVSKVR